MKDTTFIGVYDNVFTKLQCKEIIDYFEQSNGRTIIDNDEAIHHRNDEQLFILDDGNDDDKNYSGDTKIFNLVNDGVQKCYDLYQKRYWVVKKNDLTFDQDHIKIQKTLPRGGYHIWHCEIDSLHMVDRCLVWLLYLNDIPKGEGETEFLWQGIRVQPKAGTMVVWPAFFTHYHRGNPVYSSSKYIATGWGHYRTADECVEDYFEREEEDINFIRRKD